MRSWLLIAALGLGGIGVAIALAAIQARRLSQPLERVARTSAQLGDGDFSVRAPRSGVPEIDAIGQALDDSAERIADLVAREREFSANVSHQLRTPLTALRLRLEESARADDEHVLRDDLDAALVEADRLESMIADLLAHARSTRQAALTHVDLGRRSASTRPLGRALRRAPAGDPGPRRPGRRRARVTRARSDR